MLSAETAAAAAATLLGLAVLLPLELRGLPIHATGLGRSALLGAAVMFSASIASAWWSSAVAFGFLLSGLSTLLVAVWQVTLRHARGRTLARSFHQESH